MTKLAILFAVCAALTQTVLGQLARGGASAVTGRLHRREVYEYTTPNKQYKKVICGQWQSSTEHRFSQAWTQNFEYLRKTEKHSKAEKDLKDWKAFMETMRHIYTIGKQNCVEEAFSTFSIQAFHQDEWSLAVSRKKGTQC
ncbi:hypothetical protein VFPBJ_02948 [Purpureocillium lilacinum]|uniref:Uncharacterized protein n=1 Tax=Purpureocillium lilacinum TaxID=33203 RepID=A0A179H3L8_PURLI|nr:hypothetical protein VFPBJ_02948 [Purpureocillium lilacinum]